MTLHLIICLHEKGAGEVKVKNVLHTTSSEKADLLFSGMKVTYGADMVCKTAIRFSAEDLRELGHRFIDQALLRFPMEEG